MKTQNLKKEYTKEDIIKAFACLDAQILLNLYANENIAFGRIKTNDKVPIQRYVEDIGLQQIAHFIDFNCLDGHIIEKGFIKEVSFDEVCFELYRDRIEFIFDHRIAVQKDCDDENDIPHYKYGMYEYLKDLYGMFKDIITTEVQPDLFATVPDILDKTELRIYYQKVTKFVTAIRLKRLRQGGCVDRYVKGLPFISPFVMRLLKKQKHRYILKTSDTDSIDYKLALLSCFSFINADNDKLFELKMLQWKNKKAAVIPSTLDYALVR